VFINRYEIGPGIKAAKIAIKHGVNYDINRMKFVSSYNPIACAEAQVEFDAWKRRMEARRERAARDHY
jgi:hypothetical protein